MSDDILNLVRREIARADTRYNREMVGFIDSYNPDDHTAKVKYPTELDANGEPRISGWLPIKAQSGGAGSSWVFGPTVGDQCTTGHLEGDSEAGVITGFIHNTVDTPPTAQSSEGILRHTATGNYFKLNADGSFTTVHVASTNYTTVDVNGNVATYIANPGQTQHYIGGDPAKGGTFARTMTESGPSPYSKTRFS